MYKKVFLPLFFATVFVPLSASSEVQVPTEEVVDPVYRVYGLIQAGERLAWKTQVPQALKVVRFLRENVRIGEFATGSIRVLATLERIGSSNAQISIVPQIIGDHASASVIPRFTQASRILFVDLCVGATDFERGLQLIKVGFQAQETARKVLETSEFWCAARYGRYNAEMLEYRITRAYGGPAYSALLATFSRDLWLPIIPAKHRHEHLPIRKRDSREALQKIVTSLRKTVEKEGTFTLNETSYTNELNSIFGATSSQQEQKLRHHRLITHGVFSLLDPLPVRVEAEFRKTRFICGNFVD